MSNDGLNTLFGKDVSKKKDNSNSDYRELDINIIKPNSHQPRTTFNEEDLDILAKNIKENGIIQPLVVIEINEDSYELIAGERRLRASKIVGLKTVPVIIQRNVSLKNKSLLAITENLVRSDLNCVETAVAYKKAMDEFELTQDELAKKLGVARANIANHLRVLKLPDEVLSALIKNKISLGHAKILAGIKDENKVISLLDIVLKKSLSVKNLSDLLNNSENKKTKNPVDNTKNEEESSFNSETFEDMFLSYAKVPVSIKKKKDKIILEIENEAILNKILNQLNKE